MVNQVTPPDISRDSRLRIFWIEDLPELWLSKSDLEDLGQWFSITLLAGPDDVSEVIARGSDASGLPFPFDCYLTDFRLCDNQERCASESHQHNGTHASGAGFILGLMTALRSPQHAQLVIPYSVYPSEFGPVWKLLSRFCPQSVLVLDETRVNKRDMGLSEVLRLTATVYRDLLADAAGKGLMQIPVGARQRLRAELARQGEEIIASTTVMLLGGSGPRAIRLGSLFYDKLVMGRDGVDRVDASAVMEWLGRFPAISDDVLRARALADFYWILYDSDESRDIYRTIRDRRNGTVVQEVPDAPPAFPSLYRLQKAMSDERLRLCIAFFLIRRHHQRSTVGFTEDEFRIATFIEERRAEGGNQKAGDILAEILDANEAEKFLKMLEVLAIKTHAFVRAGLDTITELELAAPITQGDVLRFLDPFPDRWDRPLSLDKSSKVGAHLDERNLMPFVQSLVEGSDGAELTVSEVDAIRDYAREYLPDRESWPQWLRARVPN